MFTRFLIRSQVILGLICGLLFLVLTGVFLWFFISHWDSSKVVIQSVVTGGTFLISVLFFRDSSRVLRGREVYYHFISYAVVNKDGLPIYYGTKTVPSNLRTESEIFDFRRAILIKVVPLNDIRSHDVVMLSIQKLDEIAGYRGVNR